MRIHQVPNTLVIKIGIVLATLSALLMLSEIAAPKSHAYTPGCVVQPWGLFGAQQRAMCDGPIRADGSWLRHRIIATPAHNIPVNCITSGGRYSAFTSCYGGGWAPYSEQSNDIYQVTEDTVLPDEPGHIDPA